MLMVQITFYPCLCQQESVAVTSNDDYTIEKSSQEGKICRQEDYIKKIIKNVR
jgi:hypothetical protein